MKHPIMLTCSEPGCAAAQLIAVERSGLDERLAAIRSVGWEPCTMTWVEMWCPAHAERAGEGRGS